MARDVFPLTQMTWIAVRWHAGEDGRRDVNRHLMSVYAHPLKVYFLGTTCRWLGEPDEMVNGFFASRLSRVEFMDDWERSGLKLRRWLINAFNFYLKEEMRRRQRNSVPDVGRDEPVAPGDDPVAQAFIVSLVNHALREAERTCALEGLDEHWSIFFAHFVRDLPYASIAEERGIEPARCVVMARTARGKFRDALREGLAADGVRGEAEADSEIMSLLGELGA